MRACKGQACLGGQGLRAGKLLEGKGSPLQRGKSLLPNGRSGRQQASRSLPKNAPPGLQRCPAVSPSQACLVEAEALGEYVVQRDGQAFYRLCRWRGAGGVAGGGRGGAGERR